MDCRKAQESILASLVEPLEAGQHQAMEDHLADCGACRRFAEVQRALDARLAAAVPAACLSAGFRASLRARIRRDPVSAWPDFLPEVAHLAGCSIAVGLAVVLLPLPAGNVILAGVVFTGLTYLLQAVVRTSLEEPEGDV
jgi:hypothetical protein